MALVGQRVELEDTDPLLMAQASPLGLMAYHGRDVPLVPYPHQRLIDEYLVRAVEGEIKQLMLCAPPQHGKSELTSRYLTAWALGRFPSRRVILTSYEADYAKRWGGLARDVLLDCGPEVFGVRVRFGTKAPRSGWMVEVEDGPGQWKRAGGEVAAAGAGGPITGKTGNVIIIDDPCKNWAQATSASWQDAVWGWYRTTLFTRKRDPWCIILMQTRWGDDDLAGRLLEHEPEKWEVLSLPALAERRDPLGRTEGEALCPELHSQQELEETRQTIGPYWWGAIYQQHPQPRESAMFSRSRFRYFRDKGEYFELMTAGPRRRIARGDCMIFQTIDCAHGVRTRHDFTVVMTIAQTLRGEMLILDVMRARIDPSEQWPMAKRMRESVPDLVYQAVEAQRAGLGLLAMAESEGVPLRELKADRDKVTRATPLSVAYEAGKVYHCADALWLEEYETELVGFPVSKHDDQVDAAAYGWLQIQGDVGEAAIIDVDPDGTVKRSWTESETEDHDPEPEPEGAGPELDMVIPQEKKASQRRQRKRADGPRRWFQ